MRYHPLMSLLVIEQPTPEPKAHQCCCHDVRRQFGSAYTARKPLPEMFATHRRWLLLVRRGWEKDRFDWLVATNVTYSADVEMLDWDGDDAELKDVLLCLPVTNEGAPVPVGWDQI